MGILLNESFAYGLGNAREHVVIFEGAAGGALKACSFQAMDDGGFMPITSGRHNSTLTLC